MYCKDSKINLIILRYSRVRTVDTCDVIYHFLKSIEKNEYATIFGNPTKEIEFVDIKDVIVANILALNKNISFGQFNISSGDVISVKNLLELCALVLNKEYRYNIVENNYIIEPDYTHLDMKNAKEILGYRPKVSLVYMIKESKNLLGTNDEK